jgi:tryptophan-rich sensory protein
MASEKSKTVIKLVVSILACGGAGIIGSIFTAPAIPTWYAALQKPVFTPPNWLFGPAWGTLYLLMGIAAFLVWRKGLDEPGVKASLVVFLVQLVLNALWSIVFFGAKSLLGGVAIILALWLAILWTMVRFFKISTAAGALMVPYILWVSYASALNVVVWMLNT